ncbi:MAG: rhamnulokinase [Planctomycetes bacterium]|nr:rhamnulokinase [Planctomycetota bacterium]
MAEDFRALAVDLGASNGRALLGTISGDGVLALEEVRRFPNGFVDVAGSLKWDYERLRGEVKAAVDEALASDRPPQTVGIDTWGVDYVLVDERGAAIEQPFSYRDGRTRGAMERFFREIMPAEEIYAASGIQFMEFNTLFQLACEVWSGAERLDRAHKMLMMPDALACMLCGSMRSEYTVASTTQMLDASTRDWSPRLVESLGLDVRLLPEIVEPGTRVGTYVSDAGELEVVAPAAHDTGAAVAAVPAENGRPWAYISSGTWALVGVEITEPVLTDAARLAGLTNEGGVEGTFRLLTNVMGLWLIQECLRIWKKDDPALDIVEVCRRAGEAPAGGALVDPDNERFFAPENMPEEIAGYCRDSGQQAPGNIGAVARCVFESLALKSRMVFERIASVIGQMPETLHVVGGGARNTLLCRLTAEACGIPVVAGPAEATASGNIITQAMGLGRIGSLAEGREIVRRSFAPERYDPAGGDEWRKMYERFRELVG